MSKEPTYIEDGTADFPKEWRSLIASRWPNIPASRRERMTCLAQIAVAVSDYQRVTLVEAARQARNWARSNLLTTAK